MSRRIVDPTAPIRGAIWLYFWLLLLEGVLRKWVFPGWSDLIFVIRDPVVVFAYIMALRAGVFPIRPALIVVGAMMAVSIVFTITTNTPLVVLLFGLRTDFLHLPLIFLIPAVMDRNDVIRMGRWFMIMSIPILLLMIRQFDASADDPINASAGGYAGGQLRGAMGKIRPPGPFSFITGPVVFFGMVAGFVVHGWLELKAQPRLLLLAATAATIVAVPISISRSLLLAILTVLAFGGAVALRSPRNVPRFLAPLVVGLCFLAFAADTIYVKAFVARWDEAATAGGGDVYTNVVGRLLSTFAEPFAVAADAPAMGHGIGMGTLAGARLMSGKFEFMLTESELARLILELGPFLGFAFILWRGWLTLSLVSRGWRAALDHSDPLPWLLAGATFLNVLIGQWGQSTLQGFATLGAGLSFAALNRPPADEPPEVPEPAPVRRKAKR